MGYIYAGSSSLILSVNESVDFERIGKLIKHPNIEPGLIIDGEFDFDKLNRDDVTYYLMCIDSRDVGLCVILTSDNLNFIDVGFIKEARGVNAKKLGFLFKELYFHKYPNNCLSAMINKNHRASLLFSKWMGFKIFLENEEFYFLGMKNYGWSN
ncbi:MAG TPA: hypothetical protein VNU45_17870 [Rummeliibacillus sp.]|nr:hypothetical protein [Rummeliibacillus sp.]